MIALLNIGEAVVEAFYKLFLLIDSIIYFFVDICYRIFLLIATTNIFDETSYNEIVGRIYIVLGVVMLFVLTYTMLKAIINPEEFSKDNESAPKIIMNTITSLILIVIMPVVFTYIQGFQTAILKSNMLGNIILGNNVSPSEDSSLQNSGKMFSYLVFRPFFRPDDSFCKSKLIDDSNYIKFTETCAKEIEAGGMNLLEADEEAATENFMVYSKFADNAAKGEIKYIFLISTIAGAFLCYVMISFCFDLGIRAVKLAFLEIIAPIPIIARIMPGAAKDIFSNWVKKTLATVLEVFTRVILMFLAIFLITIFSKNMDQFLTGAAQGEGLIGIMAQAFIIMGIIAFVRSAPKLIGEIFPGLSSDNISLGIKDKLAAGGAFTAGSAIGAGVTAGARNLFHATKGWKNKNFGEKARALAIGAGSATRGLTAGLARGGKAGLGAKSAADMRSSASATARAIVEEKAKREAYRAAHGGWKGAAKGKVADAFDSVGKWAGFDNIEELQGANATIDSIINNKSTLGTAAENLIIGEANKNKEKTFGITDTYNSANIFEGGYSEFNTKLVREIDQKIAEAKANKGIAKYEYTDASGKKKVKTIGLTDWENLRNGYVYDFKNAVQNQALKQSSTYADFDTETRADLSEVRNAAEDYRNAIARNLATEYVMEANKEATAKGGTILDATTIKGDLDVTGETALNKLGNQLKISKSKNYAEISKIEEKAKAKEGN